MNTKWNNNTKEIPLNILANTKVLKYENNSKRGSNDNDYKTQNFYPISAKYYAKTIFMDFL